MYFTTLYIDLAKPKAELAFFFSHPSQGHNALPWPGLEPGSSNSQPSALTTGLLDKAVALVCPWYSWPCMLKVTPCTVVQSYGCKSKFFRLYRLLLPFCKIMGLRSASSAIMRISVIRNRGTHCFILKPLTMQGFTVSALFMNWSCIMSPTNKFSHTVFKCLHWLNHSKVKRIIKSQTEKSKIGQNHSKSDGTIPN